MLAATTKSALIGALARPLRTVPVPAASMYAARTVRWYSEKPMEDADTPADAAVEMPKEEPEASSDAALKEKDDKIKNLMDDMLYMKAELQNLQRRSAEEKKTAGDHAITRLAKDLTSSIDVLDLAIKSVPEALRDNKDATGKAERALVELFDGVSLTRKSMLDMLRTHGIEAFNPVGEKFDPAFHEALYQAPVPGKEPGTVLDCSTTGYKIKGRLLRAAQVGVVQETQ